MPNQATTPQVSVKAKLKPPALRPGDTIGIVAPASNVKRELLEAGSAVLRARGYKTRYHESIFEKDIYFAGPVDRRLRELEAMFESPDVRAILCARGGYGSNYLLDALDVEIVRQNPKIFIGYSDVTTLLTHFSDAAGLVTFHGPMLTRDVAAPGGVDWESFEAALGGTPLWNLDFGGNSGVKGLISGRAGGVLYGGCLSILVASLGTPFEIQTEGTILFIEDVNAKPFQVDRMLMQLKLAGKLAQVRGIVFGEMLDCKQGNAQDYTLEEVILRVVRELGIPVAYGLPSGHVTGGNITLPLGIRVSLTVDEKHVSLKFLEAATEPAAAAGSS
jgi:muramoyltetrapeptide carboxypeptidase